MGWFGRKFGKFSRLRKRYGRAGGATTEGHVNRVPGRLYYVDGAGNVLSKPMKHG